MDYSQIAAKASQRSPCVRVRIGVGTASDKLDAVYLSVPV